jgi:hypothetical protein
MTHTVHIGIGCERAIEKVAMMENAKSNSCEFYLMAIRECIALNAICHDKLLFHFGECSRRNTCTRPRKKCLEIIAVMMSDDLMMTEAFNDDWCSCCSIDCSCASSLYQEHTLRLNLNSLSHT